MKLILGLLSLAYIFSMLAPSSVIAQSEFKVFVIGGGIHEVDLRAKQDVNGQEASISSFLIRPESVVQVKQNEPLQIFTSTNEPQRVEKIKLTNSLAQTFDIQGTTLQGFAPGVYTLNVIVNLPTGGKGAYETVLVILSPTSQQVNPTQIIAQRVEVDTKLVFQEKPKPNPDLRKICTFNPDDKRCTPDPKKGCPPGFGTNEDGQCFPRGDCPDGYHRANDDETGRCVPDDDLKQCEDGSWAYEDDTCPEDWEPVEPEPECQPEDDFCEPGCESPTMDCIDDVNIGDDGEDSEPEAEEESNDVEEEEVEEEEEEPEEEEDAPEEEAAADEDATFG
jgi:hypothetical protein